MTEHQKQNEASIFELVFQQEKNSARQHFTHQLSLTLGPWVVAIGLHCLLLLLAISAEPSLESWSARMATLIHADLAAQAPIKIEPIPVIKPEEPIIPKTPEPPVAQEPKVLVPPQQHAKPSIVKKVKSRRTSSPKRSAPAKASSMAQAGKVIAVEKSPDHPIDLTNVPFVTGKGARFAGGITSIQGTSKVSVPTAPQAEASPTKSPRRPSKARSVSLSQGEWRCDWPKSAIDQNIYEQYVVLKVLVSSNGEVKSAHIVKDPGEGFGPAAVACALRTRFSPALNREGEAITASSPPIQVRFTR